MFNRSDTEDIFEDPEINQYKLSKLKHREKSIRYTKEQWTLMEHKKPKKIITGFQKE